jgi:hypothetical protein
MACPINKHILITHGSICVHKSDFLFPFTMEDFIFLFSNSKGLCKQLGIRVPCEELLGPFEPLRLKVPKE